MLSKYFDKSPLVLLITHEQKLIPEIKNQQKNYMSQLSENCTNLKYIYLLKKIFVVHI